MDYYFFIIVILTVLFGVLIFKFPQQTFHIQQKFYRLINWHIEPISLEKEIRNTKLMGIFLILIALAACFYKYLQNQ